jgi:hypothetical protein
MTPDCDAALCEKYPKIFRDRGESHHVSTMGRGLTCGDGWYDIIDRLCSSLQGRVDSVATEDDVEQLQVVALQVKEKFGSLCFYASGGDDETRRMICIAEKESSVVCETCGHTGQLRKGFWLRTMCDECHEAHKNRKSFKQPVVT